MDPLASSIADSETEELRIGHGDGFSGLSSDSSLSKAEAVPEVLPEKNIYAVENVTDSSLICGEKESTLKGSDE
ncbi:dentin sialophosphoprotein-like, partial [Trifolium medium]|nr:dentin sialophosphoprotein-like [Trifolium medium]